VDSALGHDGSAPFGEYDTLKCDMIVTRTRVLALLAVLTLWLGVPAHAQNASPATYAKERVTFKSDNLNLVGFLFRPAGVGPFPGLIWNHGSEKDPGTQRQFDAVAAIFVPAGYVVFAPVRRGHGGSEGPYSLPGRRISRAYRTSTRIVSWSRAARSAESRLCSPPSVARASGRRCRSRPRR